MQGRSINIISTFKVNREDYSGLSEGLIVYKDGRFAIYEGSRVFRFEEDRDPNLKGMGEFWRLIDDDTGQEVGYGGVWFDREVYVFHSLDGSIGRMSLVKEVAAALVCFSIM